MDFTKKQVLFRALSGGRCRSIWAGHLPGLTHSLGPGFPHSLLGLCPFSEPAFSALAWILLETRWPLCCCCLYCDKFSLSQFPLSVTLNPNGYLQQAYSNELDSEMLEALPFKAIFWTGGDSTLQGTFGNDCRDFSLPRAARVGALLWYLAPSGWGLEMLPNLPHDIGHAES